MSACRVTLDDMRVTDSDIARIPVSNIRVPRAEFAALWTAAEQLSEHWAQQGITDWYSGGVAATCEWLAAATPPRANGSRRTPYSPITGRSARAYEELIEAECLAAEQLLAGTPTPAVMLRRPGWEEAITATLRWAWRHSGQPPLHLDYRQAAKQPQ